MPVVFHKSVELLIKDTSVPCIIAQSVHTFLSQNMICNSSSITEVVKVFSFEENLLISLEYVTLDVIVRAWPYFNSG
jgi:hypothetical protein